MKTISTQKNGTQALRKAMKYRKGGIEMLRYTGVRSKVTGPRHHHTHRKSMKHGKRGLEPVIYVYTW